MAKTLQKKLSKKSIFQGVVDHFSVAMPNPKSELNYRSNFELLVAVILSAQCTDKRVNIITPPLFSSMPDAEAMARSTVEQIFDFIRSASYPNAKSQHLHSMATALCERFAGEVPSTRSELESLAGVGRKTASVILSVAFGEAEFAVDTHVFRVAQRIGLSVNSKTPLETEKQLVKGFAEVCPCELLGDAHHWLILHGRYTCVARKPKCSQCAITHLCAHYRTLPPAQQ